MLLVRYFLFVGGALIALLFAADAVIPKLPAEPSVAEADLASPIVRIHSDRKWPERIVFDTSRPAALPVVTADTAPSAANAIADTAVRATIAEDRISKALAELRPSDRLKVASKLEPKRRLASTGSRKRSAPPVLLAAQRQQFGFISNTTW